VIRPDYLPGDLLFLPGPALEARLGAGGQAHKTYDQQK
jgi:hypothetical protein